MLRMPKITFALGAVVSSFLVAAPAMADKPAEPRLVPFSGTSAGGYQAQIAPPNVIISSTGGSGHASHLGSFDLTTRISVAMVRGPVPNCPVPGTTEIFTATLTAANGDTITLEGTGNGCQTSPTTVSVIDAVTVTGGTGRFEGATGSLTWLSEVDQATSTVVITFDGTLSTTGSIK